MLASGFWQSALTAEQASAWPLWLRVSAAGSELAAFWPLLLACIPALAICLDRVAGEPPMRWHPVAWMGHALLWLGVRLWRHSRIRLRRGRELNLSPHLMKKHD